jgi:hypothetical protein
MVAPSVWTQASVPSVSGYTVAYLSIIQDKAWAVYAKTSSGVGTQCGWTIRWAYLAAPGTWYSAGSGLVGAAANAYPDRDDLADTGPMQFDGTNYAFFISWRRAYTTIGHQTNKDYSSIYYSTDPTSGNWTEYQWSAERNIIGNMHYEDNKWIISGGKANAWGNNTLVQLAWSDDLFGTYTVRDQESLNVQPWRHPYYGDTYYLPYWYTQVLKISNNVNGRRYATVFPAGGHPNNQWPMRQQDGGDLTAAWAGTNNGLLNDYGAWGGGNTNDAYYDGTRRIFNLGGRNAINMDLTVPTFTTAYEPSGFSSDRPFTFDGTYYVLIANNNVYYKAGDPTVGTGWSTSTGWPSGSGVSQRSYSGLSIAVNSSNYGIYWAGSPPLGDNQLDLTSTEQSLGTYTGYTLCQVDLSQMTKGDLVELTAYSATYSGGTKRLLMRKAFVDYQGSTPIVQLPPIYAPYGVEYKARKTSASGEIRIDYKVTLIGD